MNAHRKLTIVALAAGVLALLTPNARAQMLEERIRVTFSGPVELPGEVLPAGSYIFEALENGHLTRILSADEQHVYATLFTVPDERIEPVEKATIVLGESPKGIPEKVEACSIQAILLATNSSIRRPVQARISPQSWAHSPKKVAAPRQTRQKVSRSLQTFWVSMQSMLS